jgi:hypothetical protein
VSTDDPHPFEDRARLQEVCKVPGGRDVPWYSIRTTLQLFVAHAKRFVDDLPASSQFEVVTMGGRTKGELGHLVPANPGSKAAAVKAIEAMKPENGLDIAGAVSLALDAGGKDAQAWGSGPDQVVVFDLGVPWLSEVTDAEEVLGIVSWKARLRGVPVFTVGVGRHPGDLLRRLAEKTGGRYLDLQK